MEWPKRSLCAKAGFALRTPIVGSKVLFRRATADAVHLLYKKVLQPKRSQQRTKPGFPYNQKLPRCQNDLDLTGWQPGQFTFSFVQMEKFTLDVRIISTTD